MDMLEYVLDVLFGLLALLPPHVQAIEQVAFADRIMLNKCDLVDSEIKTEVVKRIKVGQGSGW